MAIKILNKARLQRIIDRMPDTVKQEIKTELENQANNIVALMRRLAPERTGELKRSINWTWGRPPRGSLILGKVAQRFGDELTITIYAGGGKAFYVTFVEWGTQHMKAQPFFYPAWRAHRKDARRKIREAVRRSVKKSVKG